ncbi:hypothetical protein KIW84_035167 [Lathyrus oleraceus]|uniref:GRF-type domain-containing protein n=1 Tax=Pisum sativum TaxID=3888 RepID=A0A9D4Y5G3_PEA|nr:hypothetical protein KIW84_035167 [Pisum sativum]
MGGSKASSTSEVGNGLPRCGCNETMKLLVSKSIENPGRKFWKCRNYMNGCGLFLWDDLVSEFAVKETNPSGCRQCEVNKAYLIEFSKEIVEEIDCRVGKLNKLEKLKKKIAMEKRKNLWEKELAAVKINAADVDIIANELELDKKVAERTLREHKGDDVAAIRHLLH